MRRAVRPPLPSRRRRPRVPPRGALGSRGRRARPAQDAVFPQRRRWRSRARPLEPTDPASARPRRARTGRALRARRGSRRRAHGLRPPRRRGLGAAGLHRRGPEPEERPGGPMGRYRIAARPRLRRRAPHPPGRATRGQPAEPRPRRLPRPRKPAPRPLREVEVGEGVRREQSRGDLVVGEEVPEYSEPDCVGSEDRSPRASRGAEDRGTTFAQGRDQARG